MRATASCGGSAITTIGPSYDQKTIAYSSRFLAYGTLSSPDQRCDENEVVDGFHTIDFTSLYYHPITTSTTTKAGCPPYVNPRLSLPAELTNVDASWASCEPLFYGAFDPPRVIKKAGSLAPPETDSGPVTKVADTVPGPSAAPAADPLAPIPGPTQPAADPFVQITPTEHAPDDKIPKTDLSPQNNAPPANSPSPVDADPAQGGEDPTKAGPSPLKQGDAQPTTQNQNHDGYNPFRPNMNPSNAEDDNAKAQPQQAEPDPQSQTQAQENNAPQPDADKNVPFLGPPPKVGGQTVQKHANGNVVVGDTTIPEGQATSVGGHEIVNNPSHVIVDGKAHDVAPHPSTANDNVPFVDPPSDVDGDKVQKQANGNVVVDGTTIPEGQSASIGGHEVANEPNHVVVDGNTHEIQPAVPVPNNEVPPSTNDNIPFVGPAPKIGDKPVQKQANGDVIVDGTTIQEGQTISIDGHEITNKASHVVIDGTTHIVAPVTENVEGQVPPVFDPRPANTKDPNAGSKATAPNNVFEGVDQPDSGSVVSGTGSIAPNIEASAARSFDPNPPSPIPTTPPSTYHAAQLKLHGLPVQFDSSGGLIVGTQILPFDAKATIAGVSVSVGSAYVALDGTTYAIAPEMTPSILPTSIPEDGSAFTIPVPDGDSVNIASLSSAFPGGILKISPGGKEVVVEGFHATSATEIAAPSSDATEEAKLGDAIMHAFSPSKPVASQENPGVGQPVFIMVPNVTPTGNRRNGTTSGVSGGTNKSIMTIKSAFLRFSGATTASGTQSASSVPPGIDIPPPSNAANSAATRTVNRIDTQEHSLLILLSMIIMHLLG